MKSLTRLDELAALLSKAPDEIFLQPHNVPDPDAIGSCAGLQYLLAARGIKTAIVYDREIEKSDTVMMLASFGIEMKLASAVATLGTEDWAVLVDGQKGAGNLTDLATEEVAAIDHHEFLGDKGYGFMDIRSGAGACSSIIALYFFENEIEPPRKIATALLFGIMKDTDSLTRGVSDFDIEMFYKLYHFADMDLIRSLGGKQLKISDLTHYAEAFRNVEVYGSLGFMRLDCPDDSLLASAGDIVLSLDTVDAVVAYAVRPDGIKFSVRSENPLVKANSLVRFILEGIGFGGGHDHMAGGFIAHDKIAEGKSIDTFIRHRAIMFIEMI
jgi:nanoRNase/pAp phosphatase (c-di-AMP/oligoRNAs hydrolase)